uniref:glutathione transferase n=1 Tax=Phallusia mammillata TaxID=59560 RepID=A0A6F9DEM5_9ASCI|nr:glutathione S-transferase Mu 3-like [Phallusia mammillata]
MSSKVILGYWNIRANGEPIRLMLNYLGVDYTEVNYYKTDDKSDWLAVKESVGIPFPNLPYLIDEDVKLTESYAIMRHLARKHGKLYPETDTENRFCDQLQGIIYDFRSTYTKTLYDRDTHDESKAQFLAEFPGKMSKFEKHLSSRKWLAGNRLMYVDFMFAEFLSCLQLWLPSCLEPFPIASQYLKTFDSLEPIASYRSTKRFRQLPILRKVAVFGGQFE